MKIILLQDKKGMGIKHDVIEAKDGYARNFLIPNGLAVQATPNMLKKYGAMKDKKEAESKETTRRLERIANELSDKSLEFFVKVGEDGSVFESVNKDAIAKALRKHGATTKDRIVVKLDHPLKSLGEHKVGTQLGKGIEAELTVVISAESEKNPRGGKRAKRPDKYVLRTQNKK